MPRSLYRGGSHYCKECVRKLIDMSFSCSVCGEEIGTHRVDIYCIEDNAIVDSYDLCDNCVKKIIASLAVLR